jgi:hypothetical protein
METVKQKSVLQTALLATDASQLWQVPFIRFFPFLAYNFVRATYPSSIPFSIFLYFSLFFSIFFLCLSLSNAFVLKPKPGAETQARMMLDG